MVSFFQEFGAWGWLIAGAILFTLEAIVPGVFLLWFGLSAVIVGLVMMLADIAVPTQLLLFAVVAAITVIGARRLLPQGAGGSDQPDLNVRVNQYIGRVFVLESPISNGRGRVKVGDTTWTVEGPDLDAGERVSVTGARGNVLIVDAAVSADDLPKAGTFS